jgi:hypothetical protein
MKAFRWNHEKNEALKIDREVSFEEITLAIEEGGLLDILHHPNQEKYPGQPILVVCLRDYIYLVPFIEEADFYFLKTIIPSPKATREDMATFKKAAQATSLKDRRVNIRLSSPDLRDIQSRAMEEGVPYQTLIASVLHKYVSGRLVEKPSRLTTRTRRAAGKNGHDSR